MFKVLLVSFVVGLNANASNTRVELEKFLKALNLGNDGFYNKALSPAKSQNLNLSDADRITEANTKIVQELDAVIAAFTNASEDKKLNNVRALVGQIDLDVIKNSGANIKFFDGKPSVLNSRTLMMIEKKPGQPGLTTVALLNALSSYKRSAIPSTLVYEYSDSRNLNQSTIKTTVGAEASWKLPLAAPAIAANKDLVLKKCRQIFGWKCVTSLYKTGQLLSGSENLKYLFAGVYSLVNNSDNPEFLDDKRSFNQITGSTALYVIKESSNWIMLYGIDFQWNESSLTFSGLILEEFLKDSKRIKERLSLDLKIPITSIK